MRWSRSSAERNPTYTRIGSSAGSSVKASISDVVGPFPTPVKSRPLTPSESQSTSEPGPPLRSSDSGAEIHGLVPVSMTE